MPHEKAHFQNLFCFHYVKRIVYIQNQSITMSSHVIIGNLFKEGLSIMCSSRIRANLWGALGANSKI